MTLLPEVETALLGAIRAQQRTPRRRLMGPAVTAAMVSLTLVVAVGALVVLRHHASPRPSAPATSPRQSSRQELLDTLGVLRRPQAGPRVDAHTLVTLLARRGNLDSSLVRTVRVAGLNDTVALLPLTGASRAGGPVTERLAVAFLTPGRGAQAPISEAVGVNVLRTHGVSAVFAPVVNDHVLVVPDGVLRVRVDHLALDGRQHLTLGPHRAATMTAPVHDNIAGLALGPLVSETPGTSHVEGVPALAQTTWLGAGGRVIAHPTVHLVVWVLFPSSTKSTATQRRSAFCRQNPTVC